MLTIETRRYSQTIKAFIEKFPSAVPLLDNKTQSGDIKTWCTNANLKSALDFSLVLNGDELLGFHDGPWNMWASDETLPLVKKLAEEKLLRFSIAPDPQPFLGSGLMFYMLSIIFLCAAVYCLLWTISSSSMAFADCNGTYSFLDPNPRCRNPAIASALLALAFFLSIACLITGLVKEKIKKSPTGSPLSRG